MARSTYLEWLAAALVADQPSRPVVAPDADMVLGYATGYGVAEIASFVRSLRTVFDGPAALVVDNEPELLAFLEANQVEAIMADAASSSAWAPHPVVARFSAYARILEGRTDVRNVVISDVRDVVFQSDPFAEPIDGLEFFVENETAPLAEHAFNMKHMRAMVGDKLASAIMDKACVCVGVVTGPREAVIRFSRMVLMLCAIPRSRVGGAFGSDQAACNLVAHLGLLGGAVRTNYGRVATIGLTPGSSLSVDQDRILNPDATASPIVHQYDRKPRLADFVDRRWRPTHDAAEGRVLRAPPSTRWRTSVLRRLPEWR